MAKIPKKQKSGNPWEAASTGEGLFLTYYTQNLLV